MENFKIFQDKALENYNNFNNFYLIKYLDKFYFNTKKNL